MRIATFEKLLVLFEHSFQKLSVQTQPLVLEGLAVMVYKAMAAQTRNFHTLDHVFDLADPSDPIQTLAALFHDIVYYQVDMGFAPGLQPLIAPYINQVNDTILIANRVSLKDKLFIIALQIFGFSLGQPLSPAAGLNEFLSALVMLKKLEGILHEKELLKLLVCLEATIPFRGKNKSGQTHFEVLELRLQTVNQGFGFAFSAQEIEQIIKTAVIFANKDVKNFAEGDVTKFLDHTWKLLPEANVALRSPELYSIREYRQALQRMEAFLDTLSSQHIFHQYHNIPTDQEYQALVKQADYNITTAREYLRMKLLATTVLEALAEISGGDAPLSLFMGDRPQEGENARRLTDFLPATQPSEFVDESTVFMLLDKGRFSEPSFDIKHSPLSVFLYTNLGPAKIKELFGYAKAFFDGQLKAPEFLAKIDSSVVAVIAQASASMLTTRREKLLEYSQPTSIFRRKQPPAHLKSC